jgi:GAF domain-containing protein
MITILRSKMAEARFQNVLSDLLEQAIKMNRAKLANMQILDTSRNCLEMVAHRGFKTDFIEHFRIVTEDDGSVCGRALKSHQTVFVEDVSADEDFLPHLPFARSAGYRAVMSTPLISSRGNIIGVISTHFNLPRRFSQNEKTNFERFCRHAADTIEEFIFT